MADLCKLSAATMFSTTDGRKIRDQIKKHGGAKPLLFRVEPSEAHLQRKMKFPVWYFVVRSENEISSAMDEMKKVITGTGVNPPIPKITPANWEDLPDDGPSWVAYYDGWEYGTTLGQVR